MNSERSAGIVGAIAGFTTVLLGAFGAHVLAPNFDARALEIWHTAILYQGLHALALLALATSGSSATAPRWHLASVIGMVTGIVLFCGSLYALALSASRWVGAITPLGGSAWLIAWAALVVLQWRRRRD